jgi:hypothetical protein
MPRPTTHTASGTWSDSSPTSKSRFNGFLFLLTCVERVAQGCVRCAQIIDKDLCDWMQDPTNMAKQGTGYAMLYEDEVFRAADHIVHHSGLYTCPSSRLIVHRVIEPCFNSSLPSALLTFQSRLECDRQHERKPGEGWCKMLCSSFLAMRTALVLSINDAFVHTVFSF